MDQLYGILILYCIVGILCYYVIVADNKIVAWIKSYLNMCVSSCKKCGTYLGKRGDNYYLPDKGAAVENKTHPDDCIFNGWNVSHFAAHTIAGYIAPDYFFLDFLIGTSFEIYEGSNLDCQDPTDIVANTIGFFVGKSIHDHFNK